MPARELQVTVRRRDGATVLDLVGDVDAAAETALQHAYDDAAAQAALLPTVGGSWQLVGPTNIGGRIVGIALDPQQRDALYVAAASGGLWRSTDAGATFAPKPSPSACVENQLLGKTASGASRLPLGARHSTSTPRDSSAARKRANSSRA